jgi:hypothetical protein
MSKSPSNFRLTDVRRGLKALETAGAKVKRVEFEGDKFVFILDPDATDETGAENEPLDKWMAAHAVATEGH